MMYIILSVTQHENKACFDQTVENIITLSNRKFNVPDKLYSMIVNTKNS